MGCGSSSQGQVAEHAVTIEQRRPPSKERVQVETSASNELEKEENTVLQEENTALNGERTLTGCVWIAEKEIVFVAALKPYYSLLCSI
jgi:hypothetical protein